MAAVFRFARPTGKFCRCSGRSAAVPAVAAVGTAGGSASRQCTLVPMGIDSPRPPDRPAPRHEDGYEAYRDAIGRLGDVEAQLGGFEAGAEGLIPSEDGPRGWEAPVFLDGLVDNLVSVQ